MRFTELAIVVFYIGPLTVCVALATLTQGWLWWVLIAAGVAWPVGNIVAGIVFGQD